MIIGDEFLLHGDIVTVIKVTNDAITHVDIVTNADKKVTPDAFYRYACPLTRTDTCAPGDIVKLVNRAEIYEAMDVEPNDTLLTPTDPRGLVKHISSATNENAKIWRREIAYTKGMLYVTDYMTETEEIVSINYKDKTVLLSGRTKSRTVPSKAIHRNDVYRETRQTIIGGLVIAYTGTFRIRNIIDGQLYCSGLDKNDSTVVVDMNLKQHRIYRRIDMEETHSMTDVYELDGRTFEVIDQSDNGEVYLKGFSRRFISEGESNTGIPEILQTYTLIKTPYGNDIINGDARFIDFVKEKYMIEIQDFLTIINTPETIRVNVNSNRVLGISSKGATIRPESPVSDLIHALNEFVSQ